MCAAMQGHTVSSPVVKYLWKALKSFNNDERQMVSQR